MALCRLAKRFSTVFSGSRQILLKKFKAFICICASMGSNREKIYGTGSAVCVGSDNTCFKSLFKNELSLSILTHPCNVRPSHPILYSKKDAHGYTLFFLVLL